MPICRPRRERSERTQGPAGSGGSECGGRTDLLEYLVEDGLLAPALVGGDDPAVRHHGGVVPGVAGLGDLHRRLEQGREHAGGNPGLGVLQLLGEEVPGVELDQRHYPLEQLLQQGVHAQPGSHCTDRRRLQGAPDLAEHRAQLGERSLVVDPGPKLACHGARPQGSPVIPLSAQKRGDFPALRCQRGNSPAAGSLSTAASNSSVQTTLSRAAAASSSETALVTGATESAPAARTKDLETMSADSE